MIHRSCRLLKVRYARALVEFFGLVLSCCCLVVVSFPLFNDCSLVVPSDALVLGLHISVGDFGFIG